jgi:hypothetical protein
MALANREKRATALLPFIMTPDRLPLADNLIVARDCRQLWGIYPFTAIWDGTGNSARRLTVPAARRIWDVEP